MYLITSLKRKNYGEEQNTQAIDEKRNELGGVAEQVEDEMRDRIKKPVRLADALGYDVVVHFEKRKRPAKT